MIALVRGTLAYKSSNHVIIDVGGVGYRLFISLSTFYSLPETGEVSLFTHTHVREDALLLYGFMSLEEKDLFVILIGISGIGPKVAINILSHIPAGDLKRAIATGDIKRLTGLPGIGKKTAERLVLELKDKIGPIEDLPGSVDSTTATAHQQVLWLTMLFQRWLIWATKRIMPVKFWKAWNWRRTCRWKKPLKEH